MSARRVLEGVIADASILGVGVAGVDAGLTLTKVVRGTASGVEMWACETSSVMDGVDVGLHDVGAIGVTGARAAHVGVGEDARVAPEIDAAVRGAIALLRSRGGDAPAEFVLALLGTGTAFASVRDGLVTHLGGTAMGGGSFAGIARRVDSALTYESMIGGGGAR